MTPAMIAGLSVLAVTMMLFIRVPVSVALGLAGTGGYLAIAKPAAVLHVVGSTLIQVGTEYTLTVVPLFVMMGAVAMRAGMSQRLFAASTALFGRLRGAESMATVVASGAFGAVAGSSLATTATMTRVAGPELRRRGYHDSMVGGTLAAGGTLGILIPPSVALVIYALITGQSVAELFAAGILPGLILMGLYVVAVLWSIWRNPDSAPAPDCNMPNRLIEIIKGWEVVLLFGTTIGGIYAGWFTPTEAASIGLFLAIATGFLVGDLTIRGLIAALEETVLTTAALFFVVLAATLFAYFIIQAKLPPALIGIAESLAFPPWAVIGTIIIFYLIAGCFLDGMGMMLASVPVFYPVVTALGYDPIWFGILVVVVIEVGLITPPIGMNIFVIRAQMPDLPLGAVYKGVLPFIVAQLVLIALLMLQPGLATTLPQWFAQ
ncbi:TRAP transporter large permease [Sulfitobacter sp. F26204]|uniref:TRAP transporter large permease n=1 Tax=Sulfitobacter sp. F26204 TaxID=2996014 RepID=UPI00225E4D2A|nr:TRAP transporter large permease [Sulfitobacter sp. F26204]MCX7561659.1 TRAP transporter large permease [Sulfitobacter sp. F26204]